MVMKNNKYLIFNLILIKLSNWKILSININNDDSTPYNLLFNSDYLNFQSLNYNQVIYCLCNNLGHSAHLQKMKKWNCVDKKICNRFLLGWLINFWKF